MKNTPRGYPYPQCNPPLEADPTDLPQQAKALAEAVADDMFSVEQRASAAAYPSYGLRRFTGGAQVLGENEVIVLGSAVAGFMASLVLPRLEVQVRGLYLITGACTGVVASTNYHGLQILLNGTLLRRGLYRPGALGGTLLSNVVTAAVLDVGDYLELAQDAGAGINTTYSNGELGAVLLAASG